jgi:purine-nucleoside phosphorylase
MYNQVKEAASFVAERLGAVRPTIGIVLGSGLGGFAQKLSTPITLSYSDIPHFPAKSKVAGHAGQFVCGTINDSGRPLLAMQGRIHYYESQNLNDTVFPIRLMGELGIQTLILTNAAGGVNPRFAPGDLMLISDHINLMGANPLAGENENRWGPRFLDQSEVYNADLIELAEKEAREMNLPIQKGVYVALSGPTYETPAEIRFLKTIGVDASGMSTVPEAIVAHHQGIKILGISCITNVHPSKTSHEEVIEVGKKAAVVFEKWVTRILGKLLGEESL